MRAILKPRHGLSVCRSLRTFVTGQSGVAMVETALVAPLLLTLFLGVSDLVLGFSAQVQLRNAVQAGASYCLHNGTVSCTSSGVAAKVAAASPLGLGNNAVTLGLAYGCASSSGIVFQGSSSASCSSGSSPGYYATVSAAYTYVTTLGQVSYPLSSQTMIRLQ